MEPGEAESAAVEAVSSSSALSSSDSSPGGEQKRESVSNADNNGDLARASLPSAETSATNIVRVENASKEGDEESTANAPASVDAEGMKENASSLEEQPQDDFYDDDDFDETDGLLHETQYFDGVSPNNADCTAVLMHNGLHRLLVASGRRVFSVDAGRGDDAGAGVRELHLAGIPANARIMALDAFTLLHSARRKARIIVALMNKRRAASDAVPLLQHAHLGQDEEPSNDWSINVYTATMSLQQVLLESDFQILQTDFIPMQLSHTVARIDEQRRKVFLACGDDGAVHYFGQQSEGDRFDELAVVSSAANAFQNLPSTPIAFAASHPDRFAYSDNMWAAVCEKGTVHLGEFPASGFQQSRAEGDDDLDEEDEDEEDEEDEEEYEGGDVVSSSRSDAVGESSLAAVSSSSAEDDTVKGSLQLEGPLSCVCFHEVSSSRLDLIVGSALGNARVFFDVTNNGLKRSAVLPQSDCSDSVLCVQSCDVDCDGTREVVIGTYGCRVLVYSAQGDEEAYCLKSQRMFSHPVYTLDCVDVNLDGVKELVVGGLRGLHVLRPDLAAVAERLMKIVNR